MNGPVRFLVLSLRRRKIGYAVIEKPMRLIDWGISRRRGPRSIEATAKNRMNHLLRLYAPSAVVVSEINRTRRDDEVIRGVLLAVQTECEQRSIRFSSLHHESVRSHFVDYGCKTKHAIANLIAETFPELAWFLPQPRKPWDNEGHHLPVFEALGAAMAFLHKQAADVNEE